jgi:hypothetical protein
MRNSKDKSEPYSCIFHVSYEAKSIRVCGISELRRLVPSIPMCYMIMIIILH